MQTNKTNAISIDNDLPLQFTSKAASASAALCGAALAQKIAALKILVDEISTAAGTECLDNEELDWSHGIDMRTELRRYECKLIQRA